jgi:hypothetical protein
MMTNPNILRFIQEEEQWDRDFNRFMELNDAHGGRSPRECREFSILMHKVKAKLFPQLPVKYFLDPHVHGSPGYRRHLWNLTTDDQG